MESWAVRSSDTVVGQCNIGGFSVRGFLIDPLGKSSSFSSRDCGSAHTDVPAVRLTERNLLVCLHFWFPWLSLWANTVRLFAVSSVLIVHPRVV